MVVGRLLAGAFGACMCGLNVQAWQDDARAALTGEAAYQTHSELSEYLRGMAAGHPEACTIESIGRSREGREIWALRLALAGEVEPDKRPALLVAANLDGDHLVGSQVATTVAHELLDRAVMGDEAAAALLTDHAVYVVPRVNPDAAERFFDDVRTGHLRTTRPDDADRDGLQDEDPPDDLNGDGLVTMMRVYDATKADRMADPGDERLDSEPDRNKGERALFYLLPEGRDDDRDGAYNEDDLGGVDLNMNFMHGYQEHADGAGPYQVSEPESLALLEYALAHQNIAVVLVYGRHDNLSTAPEDTGSFPSGAPKTIDGKDAGFYKQMSERFREITGLEKVPGSPAEGAFHGWAYAQFGVPAFSTPLWTRPAPEKKEGEGAGEPGAGEKGDGDASGLTPSGIGDISQETLDELREVAEGRGMEVNDEMMVQLSPMMVERFAQQAGIEIRRVKSKGGKPGGGAGAENKEDAAWLKYSDEQRGGEGFVAWEKFHHPDLGQVEIGGWAPYFRNNPPAEELADLAGKQVEFVIELADRLPEVSLTEPEVTRLAPGLYEIKAALVNDGYLPAGTAIAVKNRRARPWVVRLSVPPDRMVTGQRVNKTWSIPGSGGRADYRWILRAPDGSDLTITVYSEKYGEFERTITLNEEGGS